MAVRERGKGMSDRYAIGIDLGTSTSEVCIIREGHDPYVVPEPISRSPVVPSIVALDKKNRLLVGCMARDYVDMPGRGVREAKRQMGRDDLLRLGDKEFRPPEIAAHILLHLKEMASDHLGEDVTDVVITVPANFDELQRKATSEAAKIAGLNVLRWVNEPTAAALAFGASDAEAEGQILVFDFGGGTLDITILEMMEGVLDVVATYGDTQLGGKDFDLAMMGLILERFQEKNTTATLPMGGLEDASSDLARALKSAAETAKVDLSTEQTTSVLVQNFAVDGGVPIDLDLEITREDFEVSLSHLLEQTRQCINDTLNAKKVRPSSIDQVLLVGGTTYVPSVRRLVAEVLPVEPAASVNPDLAVSIGAAVRAAIVLDMSDVRVVDVASHGFGVDLIGSVGSQMMLVYEQLIAPNTAVPYSVEREFSLLTPDQRQLEINLFQSHDGTARFPHEAKQIATTLITDIPPALYGEPHPMMVEFSYSIDGVINLRAHIPGIQKSCELKVSAHEGSMSESELAKASERVLSAWKENPKSVRYEALVARAEGVMEQANDSDKERISAACADLKISLSEANDEQIDTHGDVLTDLLFDLDK